MKRLTLMIMFYLSVLSRSDGTDEMPYLSREPVGKTAAEIFGECLVSTNPVALFMPNRVSSRTSFFEIKSAVKMLGASQNERAKDVLYELFLSLPPVEAASDVGQDFETLVLTQLLEKLDSTQKKALLKKVYNQEIEALRTTYRNQGDTLYYPSSLLALAVDNIEKEKFVGEMREQFEAAASDFTLGKLPRITIRKALVHYELQTIRQLSVDGEISALVQELRPGPMRLVPYDIYNNPPSYRKYLAEDKNNRSGYDQYVLWRKSPEGIRKMALEQILGGHDEKALEHLLDCLDNQVYDKTKSDCLAWLSAEILKDNIRRKTLPDEKQCLYKQKIYEYSLSMENSAFGCFFQKICSSLGFKNPKLLR